MLEKPTFDTIFMELAERLASRSHCVQQQVGAVLAKDTRVVSIGYNGPPKGTYNCDEKWPGEGCPRSLQGGCSLALHAEQNAILYALEYGNDLKGATLYVTLSPCLACARVILSVGITRVLYSRSYAEYKGVEREEGRDFLREFGVEVTQFTAG